MKIDARKMSIEELFNLRKRMISLFESGLPVMRIADECEVSWDAVNVAIKQYQQEGVDGLLPETRGRKQGTGRTLTPTQEEIVRNVLYTKKPYQLGLKHDSKNFTVRLWSLDRVRQYILNECGIKFGTASLSLYLDRWGLRLKPKNVPLIDRCSTEIQGWLVSNYGGKVEQDLYQVYWVVRKSITATTQSNPHQGPRKQRLSVVTAISGKKNTEDYWCVYKGNFTKERQVGFLKFLLLQSDRKVLIVRTSVDHFTHKKIEDYKRKNSRLIEIIPPVLPGEIEVLLDRQQAIEDVQYWRSRKT